MYSSTTHSITDHLWRDRSFDLGSRHFLTRATNSTNILDPSVAPYTHGLDGVALRLDHQLISILWASMITVALLVLAFRVYQLFSSHLRHIYSLSADHVQQNYWTFDKTTIWPWLKVVLLYAPLGKKQHNREIQLSSAVNYGTIPGRIHTLLLLLYVISNIVYCCLLDFGNPEKAALIAEVRGRAGILATVNMVPLILFAARNNPVIPLLKISFDTFNLFHRWIGRIVIVETLVHVIAWGANSVQAEGMKAAINSLGGNIFLQFGTLSVGAMLVILFQSPSPIRHAFYETFLHLHQFLAFAAILGVYVHLEVANLPALPYIRAVVGIWISERAIRLLCLLYLNLSRQGGCTNVVVEALPGKACRVTFQLPRHVTIRPGSHIYAYLPRMSLWMSHPFSVAWTNIESEPPTGARLTITDEPFSPSLLEKQLPVHVPIGSKAPTSISLIVAARSGMTGQLYEYAMLSSNRTVQMAGFVEGPYAGHDSLSSYGTVIMFAGGAGITHHLIQIRHLIASAQARTVATRKIILAWSVKELEMLSWVRPWMDEILQMEGRRDVLKMVLYVTKPNKGANLISPSTSVKLYPGRCSAGAILDEEIPTRVGAMAVSVCGPGAFADEVRAAVRERLYQGCIDLNEESFTW
jgi:Ferric reductase like transmembrane component/Ferric reductase NAD binding domain/FAD-binding domain